MKKLLKKDEYIRTFTGKKFHIFNPKAEEVDLKDISHSLSMQCRFNSHTPCFYSVATHSIIGSKLISKPFKKEFLGHDMAEGYTGDCVTPIKRRLKAWYALEEKIERVINKKFNLPYPMSKEVKAMDNLMLRMELVYLMGCDNELDENFPLTKKQFMKEVKKSNKKIEKQFFKRFKKLS